MQNNTKPCYKYILVVMKVIRLLFTIVNHCISRSCGQVVRELECKVEGCGFAPRSV